MSREEFEERYAEHRIEQREFWEHTALLAALIQNAGLMNAAGVLDLKDDDFLEPEDFMPGAEPREPINHRLTAEESERRARERYGHGG